MHAYYFVYPHIGGTWTVFLTLKQALLPHGVNLRWLGVGPKALAAKNSSFWAKESEWGDVVAGEIDDDFLQAKELKQFIELDSNCDAIFVNVLADKVQTNIVRYLNKDLKKILIVHSISKATYDAAQAVYDYIDVVVGVSPRVYSDLVKIKSFCPKNVVMIPTASRKMNFGANFPSRKESDLLRILFLGRISDIDKGVFYIPEILSRTNSSVSLSIAGEGPDLDALKLRCAFLGDRVTFLGKVYGEEVSAVFSNFDVLLFPSKFEGLGLSLIEAMSCGCIPVASRIRGVTDYIIDDGTDGFLFDVGNVKRAAYLIENLANNVHLRRNVSAAAVEKVKNKFSLKIMGTSYIQILKNRRSPNLGSRGPLSMSAWSYPKGLRSSFRSKLPAGIKNRLRIWREVLMGLRS